MFLLNCKKLKAQHNSAGDSGKILRVMNTVFVSQPGNSGQLTYTSKSNRFESPLP